MNRQKFTYLCLILSVIGLGILQFSTTFLKPEVVDIKTVDSKDVGETVKIQGNVTEFYSTDSASFFTLRDSTGEIQVVSFNNPELKNAQKATVLGNVELRRGSLQIVSSKIEHN